MSKTTLKQLFSEADSSLSLLQMTEGLTEQILMTRKRELRFATVYARWGVDFIAIIVQLRGFQSNIVKCMERSWGRFSLK